MTSFDAPSPLLLPPLLPLPLGARRTLLALAVVFAMLTTTGWTALRNQRTQTPLQATLTAWEHGRVGGRALPDPDADPARLARFFASLTAAQRTRLVRRYPLAVGNMNGAPPALRYRANRLALRQARETERERMHDDRLSPAGQHAAGRRMHRFEALTHPDRQILAFDPDGTGRVAEVFGDLAGAERISVVVPGVDTDLLTFQRTHRRHSAPAGMARSLYDAQHAVRPGVRTAVIAWADYTAPSGIGVDAATAMRAQHGAVRLDALVRALPGDAPVSLFCHSYGSVVCGVAAPALPPRVTDLVAAGSPGMRAETAARLYTGARVWAMRDADDWIGGVPYLELGGLGHGADPVSAAFGARVLSTRGAHGHTGYFEPGTGSLANLAAIGAGAHHAVDCADGSGTCRKGLPGGTVAGRA